MKSKIFRISCQPHSKHDLTDHEKQVFGVLSIDGATSEMATNLIRFQHASLINGQLAILQTYYREKLEFQGDLRPWVVFHLCPTMEKTSLPLLIILLPARLYKRIAWRLSRVYFAVAIVGTW